MSRPMSTAALALLVLGASFATPTPPASAAPKTADVGEKGTWWGLEFLVCVADGLQADRSLDRVASQCAAEALSTRGDMEPVESSGTWWGFEF